MNDDQTTLADLRSAVEDFVQRRDWTQFHAPKNLAMSIAIEAAELMEHFQWTTVEASCETASNPERNTAVGEELADVLCYALAMANVLQLDVTSIVRDKLQKNELKYPADQYRGRYELDGD